VNELKLYQESKIPWVIVLMHRHLPADRFSKTLESIRQEATKEELDAARPLWEVGK
jgi:hypothetical protein